MIETGDDVSLFLRLVCAAEALANATLLSILSSIGILVGASQRLQCIVLQLGIS